MDKETVEKLRQEAKDAYKDLKEIESIYLERKRLYCEKSQRFMQADHELAMEDGRYKKLPSKAHGPTSRTKLDKLTMQQIYSLAKKLGVNLNPRLKGA
jgi:hypothetical protein